MTQRQVLPTDAPLPPRRIDEPRSPGSRTSTLPDYPPAELDDPSIPFLPIG